MATVEIFRGRAVPGMLGEAVEVSVAGLRGTFLWQADKSDPLNQRVIAGIWLNECLCFKVTVARADTGNPEGDAIAALCAAMIEHHAEIRDALAGAKV